jgi:hypothetical protein
MAMKSLSKSPHVWIMLCCLLLFVTSSWAGDSICEGIPLQLHHDESFETGYTWGYDMDPPDWGAFAERFDGPGEVCGIQVYLTETGGLGGPADVNLFIWESESGQPGNVISVLYDVRLSSVAAFPHFSKYDVEIQAYVDGEFFAGIWPGFPDWPVFLGADLDGPGDASSWTKVPPGQQWPSGWHEVDEVWPGVRALAIGVYLADQPTYTRSRTWGQLKGLYRR